MWKRCEVCSTPYKTKPSQAKKRRYCSRPCFESIHAITMKGKGNPSFIHGHSVKDNHSGEYESWVHLIQRCTNPKDKRWKRYGGRGITVCERWKKFADFLSDMGERPTPKHQIERVDNDKGYCPENCIWATVKQQSRNRSNNIILTYQGVTGCLTDLCEIQGVGYATARARYLSGKSLDMIFYKGSLKKCATFAK